MPLYLTDEQERLISDVVNWYKHSSEPVFQYSGPAGTGKSTVAHLIIEKLGLQEYEVAAMSYTGSAAIVMRVNGFTNACTIHSWLYRLVEEPEWDSKLNMMVKKKKFKFFPLDKEIIKLIFIDEASTVPIKMRKDLLSNGIKIIAAGDLNQLPPVADKPAFLYDGYVYYLTKIMRQAESSAIVYLSNMLIRGIEPKVGNYGQVLVINKNQLTDDMISQAGIIICGRNRTRDVINNYVRDKFIQAKTSLPQYGEKVVCRKNDWQLSESGINLANGLSGRCMSNPYIESFKGKDNFKMDFVPDLFTNITFKDVICDYKYFIANYKQRREILAKNFDTLSDGTKSHKFEFSYAITTHISQGSQYIDGIYIQEYLTKELQNHLNYTGITRFRNHCIYVLPYQRVYCPVYRPLVSIKGTPVI